jgi:predicted N-acetyltransferase YhbS
MSIRRMLPEDVDFAIEMTRVEGWEYSRIEIDRLLEMDPEGSLIWEEDGPLGFLTTIHYGRTGVIGHLVVSERGRGRRIGTQLMKHALDYLDGLGMESVILYATRAGRKLYENMGFKGTHAIHAHGVSVDGLAVRRLEQSCRPIRRSDLADVVRMDAEAFMDDRTELIVRLYDEFPDLCLGLERDGDLVGAIFGRRTPIGTDFGPWVCSSGSVEDARSLFESETKVAGGRRVEFGIFGSNKPYEDFALAYPSLKYFDVLMMVRGAPRYARNLHNACGIAGFELG